MKFGGGQAPPPPPAPELPSSPQPTAQQIAEIRQRQARGRTGRSKLIVDPSLATSTPDGAGTGLSTY